MDIFPVESLTPEQADQVAKYAPQSTDNRDGSLRDIANKGKGLFINTVFDEQGNVRPPGTVEHFQSFANEYDALFPAPVLDEDGREAFVWVNQAGNVLLIKPYNLPAEEGNLIPKFKQGGWQEKEFVAFIHKEFFENHRNPTEFFAQIRYNAPGTTAFEIKLMGHDENAQKLFKAAADESLRAPYIKTSDVQAME